MTKFPEATRYEIYFDDTKARPYMFELLNDDMEVLYRSYTEQNRKAGRYLSKAAACSVAARMIKEK